MGKTTVVKKAIFALCGVLAVMLLPPRASAWDENGGITADVGELYESQYEAAGVEDAVNTLDGDTLRYLEAIGIDGADFDGLYNISLVAVIELLVSFVRSGIGAPLAALGKVGAVLMISAVGSGFVAEENERLISAVSGGTTVLCLFAPLYETVKAALSCIGAAAQLEKILIPILAGVLTASGNPSAALSFGSLTFAAAQCVESLSETVILPLCGASLALGAAGSLCPTLKLGTAGEQITQIARKVFGFAAALFSGLLGLKEMMAKPADNLLSKSIRLAAGSFLPVVGSAVSEAYGTVAGSFSLLAATVGSFGIAAVGALCLPVITQLILWFFMLKTAEIAAGMLGLSAECALLKSFAAAVSLLNILVVYTVLVFVISSGIVLMFKA